MKVLVACEFSGIVRDAFIAKGHDAMSCDILETEKPGPHFKGDVRELDLSVYDLLIAHPPCTYLSNSGVSWLRSDPSRMAKLEEGATFFKYFLDAPVERICVENPIMNRYAKAIIGRSQTQVVQPYQFGHEEQKATALWLKNLKPLWRTSSHQFESYVLSLPPEKRQRLHYLPPSANRAKLRSMTFQGIADAMAKSWG